MNDIVRGAIEKMSDSDDVLTYFQELSPEVKGAFLVHLLKCRKSQMDSAQRHHENFKNVHGVSRMWAKALNDDAYMQKHRENAREYQRRKRAQAAVHSSETASHT